MSATPSVELQELARSFGVQVEYLDMRGQKKPALASSLLAVLRALGLDLEDERDAPRALAERLAIPWRRGIEPVTVAWEGEPASVLVRFPAALSPSSFLCRLLSEEADPRDWTVEASRAAREGSAEVDGERFVSFRLAVPEGLGRGYHRLRVEVEGLRPFDTLLIVAPVRAYSGPGGPGKRAWGIFCPLYALRRQGRDDSGNFSDLRDLMEWTHGLGGGLVATLPMLASNFDGPSPVISPYSPTSRLFWNEFYLDPGQAEGTGGGAIAGEDPVTPGLVDYGRQMATKRAALEVQAEAFFEREGDHSAGYRAFEEEYPDLAAYAFFQAAGEQHGRDWRSWPEDVAGAGPDWQRVDLRAARYHAFAQFRTDEQLRVLARRSRELGMTWYLDFPVGVDFNSFDVWRHRGEFATGASVGCPPDPVFTKGQNWGFPPLHPDRQRDHGYTYFIASLRNHFRYANALRIDHVMGLHRLFWIPQGAEARDGAFVSTPFEEIYAILSVESHRHSAWLVGEDLGTVPPEVDGAMSRHNVRGMYVAQYEARPDPGSPLRPAPETTVASVNTHDMPPFAAFWSSLDLDDRKDLGLLDDEGLVTERENREAQRLALIQFLRAEGMLASAGEPDTKAVLDALWDWLAASPAGVLLLNLEDLWLETESQNTPNTFDERPNWRRKLRRAFEEFASDPEVLATLKKVDQLRSRPPKAQRAV